MLRVERTWGSHCHFLRCALPWWLRDLSGLLSHVWLIHDFDIEHLTRGLSVCLKTFLKYYCCKFDRDEFLLDRVYYSVILRKSFQGFQSHQALVGQAEVASWQERDHRKREGELPFSIKCPTDVNTLHVLELAGHDCMVSRASTHQPARGKEEGRSGWSFQLTERREWEVEDIYKITPEMMDHEVEPKNKARIFWCREKTRSGTEDPRWLALSDGANLCWYCISAMGGLAMPVSMLLLLWFKRKVCPPCSTHSSAENLRQLWAALMTVRIFFSVTVLARTCSVQLTRWEKKKMPRVRITVSLVSAGPGIDDTQWPMGRVKWVRLAVMSRVL